MPRDDFGPNATSAIAEYGTWPIWLVDIGFDLGSGKTWKMSNYSRDITVTGITDPYEGNGVIVSGLESDRPATQCNVEVPNADKSVIF